MAHFANEITDTNFEADVLGSDKPVLVDFWAEWCGPCRMIAPTVEAVNNMPLRWSLCNFSNHFYKQAAPPELKPEIPVFRKPHRRGGVCRLQRH